MDINSLAFYLFSSLIIGFSLVVILHKNPVSSAFALVTVFFLMAGFYAMLEAHLVASIQILVYAGAIMVLFVFVIMLLNSDTPSTDFLKSSKLYKALAATLCLGLCFILIKSFKHSPQVTTAGPFTPRAIQESGGNTKVISQLMFSEYLLPFELTSILLLTGIIGAVAIAKRKPGGNR